MSRRLPWVIAAVAVIVAAALGIVLFLRVGNAPVEQARLHLSMPLPGNTNTAPGFFALSPDGRWLVMRDQSGGGLGLRSLDSGAIRARMDKLLAKPPRDMRKTLLDWAKRHGVALG